MKFLLPLLFFSFIGIKSICQQRFIEVTVADTVLAEAGIFIYKINILNDNDDYDELEYKNHAAYEKKKMQIQVQKKKTFDSLKNELNKTSFKILPASINESFFISGSENRKYWFNVVTYSKDSLQLLYDKIKNYKSIVGLLETFVAKDELPYYKLLYEKLLLQARKKADMIATISNQKTGNILSVIENKKEENTAGGWTAYPSLSALRATPVLPGWHTTIYPPASLSSRQSTDIANYPIYNSLTVRFAIE